MQNDGLRGSNERVSQFSYIKAAACFAIVLLHCFNNARVYHAEVLTDGQITTAFAACASLMWAVPCFLMVTGALLLDRERVIPPAKLFGKYIKRMLIALVVTVLVNGLPNPETYVLLVAIILTGALGLFDDASKVVHERSLGLTPRAKLVGQFSIATAFAIIANINRFQR